MKSRSIRVFISSTFHDMNEERDHLNNIIFPQIREYCENRFLQFIPIDLRWGIPEEDSKNGLVLSVCMEEIDNTRPFFIGILGSRYGWQPTNKELDSLRPGVQHRCSWLRQKVAEGASITEMEMEYGALCDMGNPYASFFIRDDNVELPIDFREEPGSDAERHLEALKSRIRNQKKYPVTEYKTVDQFGDIIKRQLIDMIDAEYPPSKNDNEVALIQKQDFLMEQRSQFFCDIDVYYTAFDEWLQGQGKVLLFTGPSPDFRSTIIATWLTEIKKYQTLYFDLSAIDGFETAIDALQTFLKIKFDTFEKKDVIVALDRDSLDYEDAERFVRWIMSTDEHLRFVIVSNAHLKEFVTFYYPGSEQRLTKGLSHDMQRNFIANYLKRSGKQLSAEYTEKIVAGKHSNDPDILELTLQTLLNYGDWNTLGDRIDEVVKRSTVDSFLMFAVDETQKMFKDYGMEQEFHAFTGALEAISLAPGINESELLSCMNWLKAKWNVVRPHVLMLCAKYQDGLLLKYREWNQVVWNITYPKYMAPGLINWYADHYAQTHKAAETMIYLYGDNIQYMDYSQDSEKDRIQGELMVKNILALAKSPEMVNRLSNRNLSYLYSMVPLNRTPMSYSPYRFIGASVEELPLHQSIVFYQKLATIAYAQNRGRDVAYCYSEIARLMESLNLPESILYRAKEQLAVGKAQRCIDMLLPIQTMDSEALRLSATQIILEAYCVKGDTDNAFNVIDKVVDKYNIYGMGNLQEDIQDPILGMFVQWLYYCCFYEIDYENIDDQYDGVFDDIIECVEPLVKEKGIGHPYTYQYEMFLTNYYRLTNQIGKMRQHGWLSEIAAVANYGKSSFLWGRAAGMSHASHDDNLKSIKKFGYDEHWLWDYTQHGKRAYCNRFLDNIDPSEIDADVIAALDRENSFWA